MVKYADYWKVLPFEVNVSREAGCGGLSHINKFGHNPDIDSSPATTPEDVWSFGGKYVFSSVATSYYISSSDNGDTQTVVVQCLTVNDDDEWLQENKEVTLQGQTKVKIVFDSGDMPIRFFRGYNSSVPGVDFAGDVYIYEDDTTTGGIPDTDNKVRGLIMDGDNQTEMAIYTIPSRKEGYFLQGYVAQGNSRDSYAVFTYSVRTVGSVFRIQGRAALDTSGSNWWIYEYAIPPKIPAKTDIIISCVEVGANGSDAVAGFDLLLVDVE